KEIRRLRQMADSPLRPGSATDQPGVKTADAFIILIFGGAGDLTKRLLVPALCNLIEAKLLPDAFAMVGVARTEMDDEGYRQYLADAVRTFAPGAAPETVRWLVERSSYIQGGFDDPATYDKLRSSLSEMAEQRGTR